MSPALKKVREEIVRRPDTAGLADGGLVHLACSNCDALLLEILLTRPDDGTITRLLATCPFCGDRSFEAEVRGGFHPGGICTPKADDPNDFIPSTKLRDCRMVDGVVHFITEKGSPDAKPLRQA